MAPACARPGGQETDGWRLVRRGFAPPSCLLERSQQAAGLENDGGFFVVIARTRRRLMWRTRRLPPWSVQGAPRFGAHHPTTCTVSACRRPAASLCRPRTPARDRLSHATCDLIPIPAVFGPRRTGHAAFGFAAGSSLPAGCLGGDFSRNPGQDSSSPWPGGGVQFLGGATQCLPPQQASGHRVELRIGCVLVQHWNPSRRLCEDCVAQ